MSNTNTPPIFALGVLDTVTKATEGVWFNILLPNGNKARAPSGREVRVKLLGQDSPVYLDALAAKQREALAASRAARPGSEAPLTDGVKEAIAILAKVIVEWEGFETPESTAEKPINIPLTVANASAMMAAYPLIRMQIDSYVAGRANFLLEQQQD